MEEVPMISSGVMSAEEVAQFEATCKKLYAGYNPHEKTTEFYGWVTSPADWQMKHQLQMYADAEDVYITFDHEQVDGWIWKKRTFYFKVTGVVSKVGAFSRRFEALKLSTCR